MPFLIQPPAHSLDAYNPLFTYTVTDPTPSELRIIDELCNWGWEVTVRAENDTIYLDALEECERCIERRRRRVGNVRPRLSLEQVWEREARKMMSEGLYGYKEGNGIHEPEGRRAMLISGKEQHPREQQQAQTEREVKTQRRHSIDQQSYRRSVQYLPPLREDDEEDILRQSSKGSTDKLARIRDDSPHRQENEDFPEIQDQRDEEPRSAFSSDSSDTPSTPVDPFMLTMASGGWVPPTYLKSGTLDWSNLTRQRSPKQRTRTTRPNSDPTDSRPTKPLSSLIPSRLLTLRSKSSTHEEKDSKPLKSKKTKESKKAKKPLQISEPVLVSSTLEYINNPTTTPAYTTPKPLPLLPGVSQGPHFIPLTEAAARSQPSSRHSANSSDMSHMASYYSYPSVEEENLSDFQKLRLDTFFAETLGKVRNERLSQRDGERVAERDRGWYDQVERDMKEFEELEREKEMYRRRQETR